MWGTKAKGLGSRGQVQGVRLCVWIEDTTVAGLETDFVRT